MQGEFGDSRVSCMCINETNALNFTSHGMLTLECLETY